MPKFVEECARCGSPITYNSERELIESLLVQRGNHLCPKCKKINWEEHFDVTETERSGVLSS